jgi:acetyl esterase/lipase
MHLLAALLIAAQAPAPAPRPAVERTEDVIYGRKYGMALTMDIYVPKEKQNGAAVIYVLSGGWFSSKQPMPLLTDPYRRRDIGKRISPVYHVSDKSAPALIVHGDADKLVPIQQAELIIDKLKAADVPCKLVRKSGLAHGWKGMDQDVGVLADWFDQHLAKKPSP